MRRRGLRAVKRRGLRAAPVLAALLLVAGCAYFNALYNARQLYDDAEAASDRGDAAAAGTAHLESLEKATRALGRDPDGRWADDALLLIGQNHFALGDCHAARTELERVLGETSDPALAARARAYLGASLQCLDEPAAAVAELTAALDGLERGSPTDAFARLWLARARFAMDADESPWEDLAVAAARTDAIGRSAALEQIVQATRLDKPDVAVAAFHALLANPAADLHADSMAVLAGAVARQWGGATARRALEPAPTAPWAGAVRDRLAVERALHAAGAGDTAVAIAELEHIANNSAMAPANAARLAIARVRLAGMTDPGELNDVRRILLPALSEQSARPIVQGIALVGILLERAAQGQPLGMFAAAEISRDRLGADALARRLYVEYANITAGGPWTSKALLAALALDPPAPEAAQLRERISAAQDPYATAARGATAPDYEASEQRLDQALTGLVSAASEEAQRRDVSVSTSIAQLDSVTAAVRADSLALACGSFTDSLGLAGLRRDSVGAACLRDDVALIDSFLRVDTTAWLDAATLDSIGEPAQPERPNSGRAEE